MKGRSRRFTFSEAAHIDVRDEYRSGRTDSVGHPSRDRTTTATELQTSLPAAIPTPSRYRNVPESNSRSAAVSRRCSSDHALLGRRPYDASLIADLPPASAYRMPAPACSGERSSAVLARAGPVAADVEALPRGRDVPGGSSLSSGSDGLDVIG
jgi:hypothetical protein